MKVEIATWLPQKQEDDQYIATLVINEMSNAIKSELDLGRNSKKTGKQILPHLIVRTKSVTVLL